MEDSLFREELLKNILQQSNDNYKDNVRIIGAIEDKAQKASVLASALLGAGLAFLKGSDNAAAKETDTLIFLTVAIVLLIICAVLCLRVMWVRTTAAPLSIDVMVELAEDLLSAPDEMAVRQERSYWDKISVWRQILSAQQQIIEAKAKELRLAQTVLAVGNGAIAVVLLDLILKVFLGQVASLMF